MSEQEQSTSSSMGTPCWIEIPGRDLEKMKAFYSALFPAWNWKAYSSGDDTSHVLTYSFQRPEGFGGGIVKMPEGCPPVAQENGSGFTVYYVVESVDKTLPRVHELGGTTVLDKKKEGDHGFFANCKDIEGNRFGIYEMVGSGN